MPIIVHLALSFFPFLYPTYCFKVNILLVTLLSIKCYFDIQDKLDILSLVVSVLKINDLKIYSIFILSLYQND